MLKSPLKRAYLPGEDVGIVLVSSHTMFGSLSCRSSWHTARKLRTATLQFQRALQLPLEHSNYINHKPEGYLSCSELMMLASVWIGCRANKIADMKASSKATSSSFLSLLGTLVCRKILRRAQICSAKLFAQPNPSDCT